MATEENIRHPMIKRANAASSSDLERFVPLTQLVKDARYTFRVSLTSDLQGTWREDIWQIFEHNMKLLYQASNFGWDPTEKREEMFHPLSRFILVWPENKNSEPQGLLAFSIFRFEREDDRNVVYCYEMQTKENARRLGLGRALVSNLQAVGRGLGMTDIMLTVFTANMKAQSFYEAQGFTIDSTSPDIGELDDDDDDDGNNPDVVVDYRILSRHIDV